MPVMRTALIALSRNKTLQDLIVQVPVSREMARRFVAGETLDEAIAAVRELNRQGMLATLDHLGENVATREEAITAADEYLIALDALAESGVDSNVSLKLTQMGLDLGDDFCYDNVRRDRRPGRRTAATSSASTWKAPSTPSARSRSTAGCAANTPTSGWSSRHTCTGHRPTSRR